MSVFEPWPLENESVQVIITSPPYYQKRVYNIPPTIIGGNKECDHIFNKNNFCDNCNAWIGQYGNEPSFQQFIFNTLLWCKEAYRVLKDDGLFFLNMGDTYSGSGCGAGSKKGNKISNARYIDIYKEQKSGKQTLPNKCKMLIPERIAITLCDELNFILRNKIIWHKTSVLPESCKDRFSQKYEDIFMFAKSEKHYFDLDSVLIPFAKSTIERAKGAFHSEKSEEETSYISNKSSRKWSDKLLRGELKGANPGDVWRITKSNNKLKHYAQFSEQLVEKMIKCSTKPGDIVLDCFAGSGTTLVVAQKLHRKSIGIDLGYKDIQSHKLDNIQSTFFPH